MSRVSSMIVSLGAILMAPAIMTVAQPTTVLEAQPVILSAQTNNPDNQEQVQTFSGTIVAITGGVFLLKDDIKNTTYGLDNQDLARPFAEKKVSVTGTLDKTRTIHIKSIEEQKA